MPNNAGFAVDAVLQNAATQNQNGIVVNVGGLTGITLQVVLGGTANVTLNPEGTTDDATWVSPGLFAVNLSNGTLVSAITVSGLYFVPIPGIDQFRCRISNYVSGTVTVTAKATNAPSPFVISVTPASATPAPVNMSKVGGNAVTLGQSAMVNAVPVVIASDQTNIPIGGSADATSPINIAGLNATAQIACAGLNTVGVQLSGAWSGTVTPQVSADGGVTWSNTQFYSPAGQVYGSSASSNGTFQLTGTAGMSHARILVSAYTSGTITGMLRASTQETGQMAVFVTNPAVAQYSGSDAILGGIVPMTSDALFNGATFDRARSERIGIQQVASPDLRHLLEAILHEQTQMRLAMCQAWNLDYVDPVNA